MIFAEMEYQEHYSEIHAELAAFLGRNFPKVEAGLQGDSWIQVLDGDDKVQVDTFTSMRHQVKSSKSTHQVHRVVELLSRRYKLKLYEPPELEGHEG